MSSPPVQEGNRNCPSYAHSGHRLSRRFAQLVASASSSPDSEVGRVGWAIMHTAAARYPDKPTKEQQENMQKFLYSFVKVFPCGYCSDTSRDYMEGHPPRVGSHHELSDYACEMHNEVNQRLE